MQRPFIGYGLGLRTEHYEEILKENVSVDWFEIITENYLVPGGKPLYYLDQISERYPIVMHGVSMSLGSTDEIDWSYLAEVKELANRINPLWISDHLCWTGINGKNTHDLLPLPYTEETIKHLVTRIKIIQDYLEYPFLIENVSSYLTYNISEMTEWQFISEIIKRANCFLLLDVNNVYVSSINHQFDPLDFITFLPSERIYQIHLAGHLDMGSYIIDTHDHPIADPVWKLYEKTLNYHGQISTMIERDDNIPSLSKLLKELTIAKNIAKRIAEESAA